MAKRPGSMCRQRLAAGVAVLALAACSDDRGNARKLRERTQSFCTQLQRALESGRDRVASGHQIVVPYGDIVATQLAVFSDLAFCASVRVGDTAALVTRFQIAVGAIVALPHVPAAQMDTATRRKLQEQLAVEASVAKGIAAMPLD